MVGKHRGRTNKRPIIKEDRHIVRTEVTALNEEIAEITEELDQAQADAVKYRTAWEAEKLINKSFTGLKQSSRKTTLGHLLVGFLAGILVSIWVVIWLNFY